MHPVTRTRVARLVVLLWALGLAASAATGPGWTQWRGPNRDGVAIASAIGEWPDHPRRVWQVEIGEGYSTPLVADDSIFVHARVDNVETVSCLRLADHEVLWEKSYPAPFRRFWGAMRHGKGPKATPALAGTFLVTLGISGVLACWDSHSGELLWRKDFQDRFDKTHPIYGTAASPIVVSGAAIAHVGNKSEGILAAIDLGTGDVRWEWTGDGPGYASPIAAAWDGVRQVITQTESRIVGISPNDGALLWQLPYTTPHEQNIVTPLLYGDTVIVSGLDNGTMAIRPVRAGDEWTVETVWHNEELDMYMSSPVLYGDYLLAFTKQDKGKLFCLRADTGATVWQGPGRQGDNAAIVRVGEHMLALLSDASLLVGGCGPDGFVENARYTVSDSPTWAHPVIVGDSFLVRGRNSLALWTTQ